MNAISAVVRNGRLETDERVNLPDGTEVRLWIESPLREADDLPPTPEEIAQSLAAMERVEPFVLTSEESDAWNKMRQADKAFEQSQCDQRDEQLRKIWE